MDHSTISSVTLGRSHDGDHDLRTPRPQLFMLLDCDHPSRPPSRHLLDDIDEVRFGRGDARFRRDRDARRLQLWVPDGRMSIEHARLVRVHGRWLLEDLGSKNGCVVNGNLTRRSLIADGDLFELGHTFFMVREAPVGPEAVADLTADQLAAPLPLLATFVASLEASFAALARVATAQVSVLVLGETGTGKEVVARALHQLSGRVGPLVPVNCGALPETLLEAALFGHVKGAFSGAVADRPGIVRSADGGTLFLDEIGDLPAESQVAFLRVLQEHEVVPVGESRPVRVDLRVCAATHCNLDQLVEAGAFRRDLAGRLMGLVVELPPLRGRREDLGILIGALLRRLPGADQLGLAPAAVRRLFRHDWPLNIRELDKCLSTAVALSGGATIERKHLPAAVRGDAPAAEQGAKPADLAREPPSSSADERLRAHLEELLVVHEGNVAAVARAMSKGRMQIHRWAHRFGLDLESYRRRY